MGSWDAGNIPSLELGTVTGLCSLGEKLIGMCRCGSGTFVYECHTSVEISKNKYRYSAKMNERRETSICIEHPRGLRSYNLQDRKTSEVISFNRFISEREKLGAREENPKSTRGLSVGSDLPRPSPSKCRFPSPDDKAELGTESRDRPSISVSRSKICSDTN